MFKKLFYITFLFSIILTGNNIASDTDYSICATNADGAILVIENFILFKKEQSINLIQSYEDRYELD